MPAHNVEYCGGLLNGRWGGVRPAPVCPSADGGVLISTSCYHGFERLRQAQSAPLHADDLMELDPDCDMPASTGQSPHSPPTTTSTVARKRSSDESECRGPTVKRVRQEVQKEKLCREEIVKREGHKEEGGEREERESVERLLWSTHGASLFQLWCAAV